MQLNLHYEILLVLAVCCNIFIMIYDRSYMRQSPDGKKSVNPVLLLIVANLVFFIIQGLPKMFGSTFPIDLFEVSKDTIFGAKVWTLITYSFFHDTGNLMHIFFNMLMLYFVGGGVVQMLGDKVFYQLYFTAAVIGALFWYFIQDFSGFFSPTLVGASAACYGLIIFICVTRADEKVMLIFPPVEVKPKWLGWFLLGLQMFLFLTNELPGGEGSNVAHSAHLGGMLVGFLWGRSYQGQSVSMKSMFGQSGVSIHAPSWMKKKNKAPKKFTVNFSMDKKKLQKEVDRILDKINAEGFGALNDEEKATLDKAKDILGK